MHLPAVAMMHTDVCGAFETKYFFFFTFPFSFNFVLLHPSTANRRKRRMQSTLCRIIPERRVAV